jgi:hypothetical protein
MIRRYAVASTSAAVLSRLSLIHGCRRGIAALYPGGVEDARCVAPLIQRDSSAILVHLDPQVEGEEPEIAHEELCLHFILEAIDLGGIGSGNHQIVDVDADEQTRTAMAAFVDNVLMGALFEPKVLQRGVEARVPCALGLAQPVEHLLQATFCLPARRQ